MLSISSITGGLQQAVFVVLAGLFLGLSTYLLDPALLGTDGFTTDGWVLAGTLGVLFAGVWGGLWSAVDTTLDTLDVLSSVQAVVGISLGQGVVATLGLYVAAGAGTLMLEPLLNGPLWPSPLSAGVFVLLASATNGLLYLHRYHEDARTAATDAAAAQVRALQGAVQPGAMVHTLDRIAASASEQPEAAADLAADLADLMRYRFHTLEFTRVTLAEELNAAQQFFAVQAAYQNGQVDPHFDVPEALFDTPVPGGVLLPLLENAIVHGTVNGPCRVVLQARQDDGQVCITLFDTGPGFDTTNPEVLLSRGHGLERVSRRLDRFAGEAAGLSIVPNGVHVCVPVN